MIIWIAYFVLGALILWLVARAPILAASIVALALLGLLGLWAISRLSLYWAALPTVAGALLGVVIGGAVMLGLRGAGAALVQGLAGLAIMFLLSAAAYTLLHFVEHGSPPPEFRPVITWGAHAVRHVTRWFQGKRSALAPIRAAIPASSPWR